MVADPVHVGSDPDSASLDGSLFDLISHYFVKSYFYMHFWLFHVQFKANPTPCDRIRIRRPVRLLRPSREN